MARVTGVDTSLVLGGNRPADAEVAYASAFDLCAVERVSGIDEQGGYLAPLERVIRTMTSVDHRHVVTGSAY